MFKVTNDVPPSPYIPVGSRRLSVPPMLSAEAAATILKVFPTSESLAELWEDVLQRPDSVEAVSERARVRADHDPILVVVRPQDGVLELFFYL